MPTPTRTGPGKRLPLRRGGRPAVAVDDRYLLVPDVLKALQDLATHHRRQFGIPVVAITGSNGKTTTKELVHAVLSADRPRWPPPAT